MMKRITLENISPGKLEVSLFGARELTLQPLHNQTLSVQEELLHTKAPAHLELLISQKL